MAETTKIITPSKPEVVSEDGNIGVYTISGLYPGYGYTLGNVLRRMVLSSIPGVAVTKIRIKGVAHEFSTIKGVKEDVLTIVLKIKRLLVAAHTEEFPQVLHLKKKGKGKVTAKDFSVPSQVEIKNPDFEIAEITDANTELDIEVTVEKGIGFQQREYMEGNAEIDALLVDAQFSPVKRAFYDVEEMRVGNRTDYNQLKITIETDGTVAPREALDTAIQTMVTQFQAMIGFRVNDEKQIASFSEDAIESAKTKKLAELGLSASIQTALEKANIKSVVDIEKKGMAGIKEIKGVGDKAVEEIVKALAVQGITLK